MNKFFSSDNYVPASPEILEAVVNLNSYSDFPYGEDETTKKVRNKINEIFETNCEVYFVSSGTSANALALSSFVNSFGGVMCHPLSHINCDEAGAVSFFTGGGQLILIDGGSAKISIDQTKSFIDSVDFNNPHASLPQAISITQLTESGTTYFIDEIRELSNIAKRKNIILHMDGARFANALINENCSPAALTWKSGIDVLSFGGTKNGCINAEAVIFFKTSKNNFINKQKQSGHLNSKTRYISCQFEKYFEKDLWLINARNANNRAQELLNIFKKNKLEVVEKVQGNELFVNINDEIATKLRNQKYYFYDWNSIGPNIRRFVTNYSTSIQDIEGFEKDLLATI